MSRVVAGLCCAVLALTACSSNSGPGPGSGSTPARGTAPTSVLDRITPQQICGMVDAASIKKAVGVAPEGANSRRIGKAPITTTYTCDYKMGVPGVSTEVATTELAATDAQVLDDEFTDMSRGEHGTVVQHEAVPGLGVLAGYGPDPTLSGTELNGHLLSVVFRVGAERLVLGVSVFGDATLDKLEPVAAELMKNLQAAVG